jgi:hypothetical protein
MVGSVDPSGDWGAAALVGLIGLAGAAEEWGKGRRWSAAAILALTAVFAGALAGALGWVPGLLALGGLFALGAAESARAWREGRVAEARREVAFVAAFTAVLAGVVWWAAREALAQGPFQEGMTPEKWRVLPAARDAAGAVAAVAGLFLVALGAALLVNGPGEKRPGG